jgi:molecular chaperone DnaJ
MAQDFYSILGVNKGSSDDEIKKAYRNLVKKHHPDRFKQPSEKEEATKKFQEIQSAYDVLSDEKKKKSYDAIGHDTYTKSGGQGFGGFEGGFGGFDFGGFDIFNDIFSQFGGASGQSAPEYSRAGRGEDLRYAIEIDLEEAFSGKSMTIKLPKMVACVSCDNKGVEKGSTGSKCGKCNGTGRIVTRQMFLNVQQTCHECNGRGVKQPVCKSCRGVCRVNQKVEIDIEIPKGVTNGLNLRMQGKGNAGVEGGASGDLFIELHIRRHPLFEVDGNNLICTVPVSVQIAVLGGEILVPTIEGQSIQVKIPVGTVHGAKIKVQNKGMPYIRSSSSRGDMHVKVEIDIPTSLSSKEKDLWKQISEIAKETDKSKTFSKKMKDFFSKNR